MANKELCNILKVGDDTYNINAVHSDAAAKVDHTLTINKISDLTGTVGEEVKFNGNVDRTISIVPSEGGAYTGPVLMRSLEELGKEIHVPTYYAINHGDVLKMVKELTGHPCYYWTWDAEKNEGNLVAERYAEDDPLTLQKVSLIIGTLEDYIKFIETSPNFFLYFCSDTGQIFFGQAIDDYMQLGTKAYEIVDKENPEDSSYSFDFVRLTQMDDQIKLNQDDICIINDPKDGILAQSKDYTDDAEARLERDLCETKTELDDKIEHNKFHIEQNAEAIDLINDPEEGILAQAREYTDDEFKVLGDDLIAAEELIDINTTSINEINNPKTGILAQANINTTKKFNEVNKSLQDTRGRLENNLYLHEVAIKEINDSSRGIFAQAKSYADSAVAALNSGQVAINKDNIGSNTIKINKNTESITKNTNSITILNSKTNTLEQNINSINNSSNGILVQAKNYTNTSVNNLKTGQVATNARNISANTTNIASNKANISLNDARITANTNSINTINNTKIPALETSITNQFGAAKLYAASIVSGLRTDIANGTTTAQKANKATEADFANTAQTASAAASASKAYTDSAGNTITTYYQKKITISSSNPSGGSNGDIWIVY